MESSESVYYATDENSEIIEEEGQNWGMENVVIVDNDNLTWQEDSSEVTVNYADATENPEQTLTENEIYISNTENSLENSIDPDKSEYYSILDGTYQADATFDDDSSNVKIIVRVDENNQILHDPTPNDETKEDATEETEETELENQVFLYSTEDSDEMYAVQIADDGNGNLQRYKYKVRHTVDGQLEAIPGTIELQVDDLIEKDLSEQTQQGETENEAETETEIESQNEGEENLDHEDQNDFVAIKHEICENSNSDEEDEYGTPEYLLSENELEDEPKTINNIEPSTNVEIKNERFENERVEEKRIQHKFFKSKDINNKAKPTPVYKSGERKISYLLLDSLESSLEKENVEENLTNNIKNSRSLLKNTVLSAIEEKEIQDTLINIMQDKKKTPVRIINNNKSFKENNESVENIEKVIKDKSVRQPRKQTITPIERSGSEIIVQPMFYSFGEDNSFLVPIKRKLAQNQIDEVVRVSDDSEDEFTEVSKPKKKKRPSKKPPKKIEHITISDTENSDTESIIEITESEAKSKKEEDEETEKFDDITKIQEAVNNIVQERNERNRVNKKIPPRPSPTRRLPERRVAIREESKTRTRTPIKKNNIKCPKCPKTFPREINLKNHMNIHNARRSLRIDRTKEATKPMESKTEVKPEKYYCAKCKLKFLTEIQLKRHLTIHKSDKATPKKIITNQIIKKSPIKLRKSIVTLDTKLRKSIADTKMSPRRPFKCDQCPMSFSQRTLLASHKSKHKLDKFHCTKCNIKFTSKQLLDDHVSKKCMEKRNSILSLKSLFSCSSCKLRFRSLELLKLHEVNHKKAVKSVPMKNVPLKNVTMRSKKAHGGVPTSDRMQKAFDMIKSKS